MFKVPEKCRVKDGALGSVESDGNNGCFLIKEVNFKREFKCIVSDGLQWEHVSVSLPNRAPTWREMCFIKDKFWDKTDCVIQYHPAEEDYVNYHPYCLHLWRPMGLSIPKPPPAMVGPK